MLLDAEPDGELDEEAEPLGLLDDELLGLDELLDAGAGVVFVELDELLDGGTLIVVVLVAELGVALDGWADDVGAGLTVMFGAAFVLAALLL